MVCREVTFQKRNDGLDGEDVQRSVKCAEGGCLFGKCFFVCSEGIQDTELVCQKHPQKITMDPVGCARLVAETLTWPAILRIVSLECPKLGKLHGLRKYSQTSFAYWPLELCSRRFAGFG